MNDKLKTLLDSIKNYFTLTPNHEVVPYIPFPISLHCVDIVPYYEDIDPNITGFMKGDMLVDSMIPKRYHFLLGRKKDKTKFQFIGGFMNPGETAEDAASRELLEETGLRLNGEIEYLKSFFIDDERYQNSPHKITSSFFCSKVENFDNIKANDDIEEVKKFELHTLRTGYKNLVVEKHWLLIEFLLNKFDWVI